MGSRERGEVSSSVSCGENGSGGVTSTLRCGGDGGDVASCPQSAAAGRRRWRLARCRHAHPRGPACPCAAAARGALLPPPCCWLTGGGSPMPGGSSGSDLRETRSWMSRTTPRCCSLVTLGGGNVWHCGSCEQ